MYKRILLAYDLTDRCARSKVVVFPDSPRGFTEGHYPWDIGPRGMTTNTTIAQKVQKVDGEIVDVTLQGRRKENHYSCEYSDFVGQRRENERRCSERRRFFHANGHALPPTRETTLISAPAAYC